jgi:hypothetical protein
MDRLVGIDMTTGRGLCELGYTSREDRKHITLFHGMMHGQFFCAIRLLRMLSKNVGKEDINVPALKAVIVSKYSDKLRSLLSNESADCIHVLCLSIDVECKTDLINFLICKVFTRINDQGSVRGYTLLTFILKPLMERGHQFADLEHKSVNAGHNR